MKKLLFGIILFSSVSVFQANAQIISGGIKAEANGSGFFISDIPGTKSNLGTGGTFGAFAKLDLAKHFALQAELLFNYQESKLTIAGSKNDFRYLGLEIPVYAMGQWYTASGNRFYVGIGPYAGYGLQAKFTDAGTDLYGNDTLQPWDFGGKAIAGFEFANGIQINAGYRVGLYNSSKQGAGKMLPQVMSLGIGYRF